MAVNKAVKEETTHGGDFNLNRFLAELYTLPQLLSQIKNTKTTELRKQKNNKPKTNKP